MRSRGLGTRSVESCRPGLLTGRPSAPRKGEERSGIITLLTDFGSKDAYAGILKGVIAGIAPAARVIDICHEVPPQDLRRAGLVWSDAVPYFPPGTIHVAVVDPGVGGRRRILAFEGRGAVFLAPDNGLIGHVLQRGEVRRVVAVERAEYFLEPVSATFHGRDILAPVAARLATGLPLVELGQAFPRGAYLRDEPSRPRIRRARRGGRMVTRTDGEVISLDAFGNAITSLRPLEGRSLVHFEAGGRSFSRLSRTYGDVKEGEAALLVGSSGRLEVAVNRGSAARDLGLAPGDRVMALWSPAGRSPKRGS